MLPCLSWELSSQRFSLHHRYRLRRVEVDEQPVANRKEKTWRMNFNAVNYSYKDAQARSLPSPPPPPSNPSPQYKSTNNTMPVSIYPTTKKKNYKGKEIKPFTVKANRRTHISIWFSRFVTIFWNTDKRCYNQMIIPWTPCVTSSVAPPSRGIFPRY